jgi:hypothetical protein
VILVSVLHYAVFSEAFSRIQQPFVLKITLSGPEKYNKYVTFSLIFQRFVGIINNVGEKIIDNKIEAASEASSPKATNKSCW